jgi:hypothetical protein
VLVVLHTTAYTVIGPKDELQHIDYADKVSHFDYPRFPEPIGQRPLREEACRRIDSPFDAAVPSCDLPSYDPAQFQEEGLSTQTFHPPIYYTVVGFTSRVVGAVLGLSGMVGMERLLGAVWLSAALCVAYAAARRLGADVWVTVALLVMVASVEPILYSHSTVSNDATAVLTGALCLLAVVRDKAAWTWSSAALLVGVGVFAGGTKITNGFGVGAACLFAFFAPWVRGAASDLWSRLRPGALLAGGYLVATVAWQLVFERTQVVAPRDLSIFNRYKPPNVDLGVLLSQMTTFANPFNQAPGPHTVHSAPAYVPELFNGPFPQLATLVVSFVLIAGAYGSWTLLHSTERREAPVLGASVSVLLLIGGPLQFLAVYLSTTAGYTETRYTFSMVPAMLVTCALLATSKARLPLGAIAGFAFASTSAVALWSHIA